MDTIELGGLTYYGYHGALPEERTLGQRFVVSVRLGLDLRAAGAADDLALTVDYGALAEMIRTVVEGEPFQLIEALAEALATTVIDSFAPVQQIQVRVEKPSAPVASAPSGLVAVQITRCRDEGDTSMPGSVLGAEAIRALLAGPAPLAEGLDDPTAQIQPNGLDLSLESVWRMEESGAIGRTNAERQIPPRVEVLPDAAGWYQLAPGSYIIRLRETVALPLDVMAFGRPRSSLLRCGTSIHTAVWDAGYRGRSEALLIVHAPDGFRVAVGARVMQLVFVRLVKPTHAYTGTYQGENLPAG